MICKKISSKITFIPAVISVGLFGLVLIANLIMLFINFNWWLTLPFLILSFTVFVWALIISCHIIEFYDDKLIFKTVYGKILKEVAKEEVKAITYLEEVPLFGYRLRYYIFDIFHNKKFLITPFRMECNEKMRSF